MVSYAEQQKTEGKVRSFLSVFFNALEQNESEIFKHLTPNTFPGVFDINQHEYLSDLPEFGNKNTRVTGADKCVFFQRENSILCIQKLDQLEHYHGFELVITREVTKDWLTGLSTLITYAAETRKNRLKEVLLTYQSTGYRIKPISPTLLADQYQLELKRAKLILS